MKHPKFLKCLKEAKIPVLLLALVLLAAVAVSGCKTGGSAGSTSAGPKTTMKITDMTGREIVLDKKVTRVVALAPADCEILYALGAGSTLVGRGEYCDYPAEVQNVPAVQSGSATNVEQIIALSPQVLIMATMDQTDEQVAALEKAGIRVVVSDAHDIAGTYEAIELLGTLTGREKEADTLVGDMKETFAALAVKAGAGIGKSVYFEVSPLQFGLWTAGKGSFMNEIADMLKLTNIFGDVSAWAEVTEEQVIERNPDFIVTVAMYFGEGPKPEEEILSRAAWKNIKAVKNEKVLNLWNNELSRPGPRLAEGAEMLYAFVYGDDTP